MAFHNGPKPIVTNGLFFCVDFLDSHSYPGSGTTITELILPKNGSIEGSGASVVNGYLDLPGSGGAYAAVGPDTSYECPTAWTIMCWAKLDTMGGFRRLVGKQSSGCNYGLGFQSGYRFGCIANDTGFRTHYHSSALNTGQWYHLVGIYNGSHYIGYADNTQLFNQSITVNMSTARTNSTNANVQIGTNLNGGELFHGLVGPIQIYNRALSSTEVSQNFNAHRGRFGV